jgi:hypothetical protein
MEGILILGEITGDLFHQVYEVPKYFLVNIEEKDGLYEFIEDGVKIFEAKSLKGVFLDYIYDRVLGEYWDFLPLNNQDIISFELWLQDKYFYRMSWWTQEF